MRGSMSLRCVILTGNRAVDAASYPQSLGTELQENPGPPSRTLRQVACKEPTLNLRTGSAKSAFLASQARENPRRDLRSSWWLREYRYRRERFFLCAEGQSSTAFVRRWHSSGPLAYADPGRPGPSRAQLPCAPIDAAEARNERRNLGLPAGSSSDRRDSADSSRWQVRFRLADPDHRKSRNPTTSKDRRNHRIPKGSHSRGKGIRSSYFGSRRCVGVSLRLG